jgi:class 3 adenylate cyclase/tetratricopeptide (TPR) repeat protein
MAHVTEASAGARASAGNEPGQRRNVTVLFADMVGYTAFAERLGEEDTYLIMQRVHRALSEAVHAEDGTVQEVTGDGVMALFGAPVALEDAPLHACRSALSIQQRMIALAGETESKHGHRFQFRVGIHSGPLVVGEVGDAKHSGITALGDTVNLASRIEAEAGAGEIFFSEATHDIVQDFVECTFAGERTVKGKSGAQRLWRLDGIRQGVTRFDAARNRGLTSLVGRAQELEALLSLWSEASAGALRAVAITGEAGIGKSRLAYELRERIDDGHIFILEGHCTATRQSMPFSPLIEVVRSSFRIPEKTGAEETRRKLQRGLELLGIDPSGTLACLLNLLGHPPPGPELEQIAGETLGIRTRDAILAMLRERCRITPTALIIEDMHWTDSASEQLLRRIVESERELPLLLVSTARAGYEPPWTKVPGASEIRLKPLSKARTKTLLFEKLGSEDLPEELVDLVTSKSEGNPLFAEEIANFLHTSQNPDSTGGKIELGGRGKASSMPVTLENLLMDRFDRLEPVPRAILETAAAIGPRFSDEIVATATGFDGKTVKHLQTLEQQELIVRDTGGWRFRHVLACDAIYNSLLTPTRQKLHAKIAKAIEERTDSYPDEDADLLAYHWSRSAQPHKAISYLKLAGESSLRIYSLEEAESRFRQALELIEENVDAVDETTVVDLALNIARVMYFQYKFYALIELVNRYLPRVEALGDKKRLSRFLFETGYAHVFSSQVVEGRKLLGRARKLGEELNDELSIAYADLGFMWDRMYWGKPGEDRSIAQQEAGERLVEVGRRHGDIWLASKARLALGLDLALWGQGSVADAEFVKLMNMSRETNDPRPRAMALWAFAAVEATRENPVEAIEYADEALRISLCPVDRSNALGYKGISQIMAGDVEAGVALISKVVGDWEREGLTMSLPPLKIINGVGVVLLGEMAEGMAEIKRTIAWAKEIGQTGTPILGTLFLGETYFRMAESKEKPPLSVIFRNFFFLSKTLPFAKSLARREFEKSLEGAKYLNAPTWIATSLHRLGILDRLCNRIDDARTSFKLAREISESVGDKTLTARIDDAIAALD